jgi:hypothetical protein
MPTIRDRDRDPPGFARDVIREMRRILRLPAGTADRNAPLDIIMLRAFALMVKNGEVFDRIRAANSKPVQRQLQSYIKQARRVQAARARLPALFRLEEPPAFAADIAAREAFLQPLPADALNPKRVAAQLAVTLLCLRNLPVSTTVNGKACKLAALLYSIIGEPDADLQHYVQEAVRPSRRRRRDLRSNAPLSMHALFALLVRKVPL